MIEKVSFSGTTFKEPPYRFEAGTPPIAQAIGLGSAIKYISELGMKSIIHHEDELLRYGTERLNEISGLKIFGNAKRKAAIFSFVVNLIFFKETLVIVWLYLCMYMTRTMNDW